MRKLILLSAIIYFGPNSLQLLVGELRQEIKNLKEENLKLKEENRILKTIVSKRYV